MTRPWTKIEMLPFPIRRPRKPSLEVSSSIALNAAFALTGFATALLGATLPVMRAHWSLTDRSAGVLFLVLFLGSSLGALASFGRATHSLARGTCLIAPVCFALAFARGIAIFPLCFLYGLGLGITITSISLVRSQRLHARRARELNRLNLIWVAGAFLCPWLANRILQLSNVETLFLAVGAAFSLFAIWTLAAEVRHLPSPCLPLALAATPAFRLPWAIAVATMLATGLESCTGAWIGTYAGRLRSGIGVEATTLFWFGLLASRALHSTSLPQRFSERALLRNGAWIATCGSLFVLANHLPTLLLPGAFLIGFGVGPIYPLLLALTLPRVRGNVIFLMGGVGSALLPWLTGTLSARAHSLHVAMIVPSVAAIGLLLLARRVVGSLRDREEENFPSS